MPVIYNSIAIVPAPFATISKSINSLGDGRQLDTNISVTLKGTLSATMGSLSNTEDGYHYNPLEIQQRLSSILTKQQQLRNLFSVNGQWLEIQGLDGTQAMKFTAIVDNIEFDEGPWVEVCQYTITLHGEAPAGEDPLDTQVESATENWQFQEGEGLHTYNVSHTLSAKGKTIYDATNTIAVPSWKNAKNFVTNQLMLGWTTTGSAWSPLSGQQMFVTGNMTPEATFHAFNRIITEQIDETEGTYNLTETFVLSEANYWEEYTISTRKETGNPLLTTVATISGTIHGLTTNLHDPEGRTANALAQWNTVQTLLYTRISAYSPGITFNTKRTSHTFDVNVAEGVVSYNCEFDDRILINNTYEWYNVILEANEEDSKTVVRIDGVIIGVRYWDDIYNPYLPYERANTQYQLVKLLMFQRAQSDSGITDLKAFPVSASVTPDKQAGSVSYSYTFDNRIPELVRDEFNVNTRFSREDGITVVVVSGTITGLRQAGAVYPFGTNDQFERYENALGYFEGISGSLVGLAGKYVDVSSINPVPYSKTVTHVPNGGQVNYEYEFNSKPQPCFPGSLSENITITEDAATPVIAIIPVLGRAKGPVIQNIGTVKERRRSVSIEIVMPVSVSTNVCSSDGAPNVDISGYAPNGNPVYLEQDQTQWSPSNGHFSRTLSWVYE